MMKKFKSEDLINELKEDVQRLIESAEFFKQNDKTKLTYPIEGKWAVVQILEHLNMYSRYYLPVIQKAVETAPSEKNAWFNSGRFGNYFTKMMKPTNVYEIKNKMKAMKSYTPTLGLNVEKVLNEFLEHKHNLLHLLELSKSRNLNKIRIPITISKFIKFKLGDTFRFLIAHEQRHMMQARNTLHELGISTSKFPVILQAVPQ